MENLVNMQFGGQFHEILTIKVVYMGDHGQAAFDSNLRIIELAPSVD